MKSMIERTDTEELIKILGDNSPIGVCIIQEGKFCYINPAFLLFTGYSADELEGRDASDIVVPEDREMVRENTIKMLKGEHSFLSQFRVACEDGSTRWVMETVTSIQYHGRRATLEYYMDITERKQAEDALRESEQNLIRGQEIGQMGYWKLNPVTQNVEASDELLEIFELGRDELTLDAFANVVHPEDREYDLEHIQRGMEEGVPWDIEHRLLLKNGSIKWIRAIGEPNLDENGKVTDVMGIVQDITERKKAEEGIRVFSNAIASSINAVAIADLEGNLTHVNKSFLRMWGYDDEKEVLGKNAVELWQVAEEAVEVMQKALNKEGWVGELAGKRKDGSIFDVLLSASVVRDEAGRPICRSGSFIDITERKQAEEKLQESKMFYENLLNATHEPLQVVDSDLRVVYANEQYIERLISFGIDTEIIGKPLGEVCPFLSDHAYQDYQVVFETGKPIVTEETTEIDGTECYTETTKSPVFNAAGDVSHAITVVRDITEHKKAEKALRQSEERYRTILEETGDGYFETDLAGNFTFVNDAQARLLGYSKEELIGATYRTFTPEENVKAVFKAYHRMYRTGEPLRDFPDEIIRKDGSLGFAETSAFPIRNGKGEIIGFRGVRRDITERKRAEEALKQSRQILESVLESAPDGVYVMDLKGTFLYGNQKAEEIVGYSRNELIGHSFLNLSLLPEEQLEKAAELLECNIRGQSTGPEELQLIRKNSTRVWTEISTSVIQRGEETVVIGFVRDITERKQAEEALQQSEQNYRTLFDSEVVGTIVIDAETMKLVTGNQAAARMFGFSSVEEAIGINPLDFIPPDERPRVFKIIVKDMFEQDLRQIHDFRVMTKDGREIWICGGGARIMHEGKLMGLISFTDITKQKQQNERLMLTDRLASIGELAAGAAHELNNPLTSVIGFSQLIMGKDIPDDIRQDLTFIHSEAQRAAGITNNLLAFAQKHKPVKQLNQINIIIEDVLKLRAYEHKIKDIEVDKQLASDLPESMVDYFQMQQVFFNIVINAEYFMTKAHDRGTLTITTEKQNGTVRISFADDGPGIPPENLSQLFNPFFTTKETGKGTGLGLSICHGVVSEHGGQMYARSQPGKGATIFVELPINGR